MDLLRVAEIATRQIEILRHDAEGDVFRTQDLPHLSQHFLDADIGTRIARPVIAGEQQLEPFSGLPGIARTEHPFEFIKLNEATHPGLENKIHHGRKSRAVPARSNFVSEALSAG